MIKTSVKKYFLKTLLSIYIATTLSIFLLQLEAQYRTSLINHGFNMGEQTLIMRLSAVFQDNPCEVVSVDKDKTSISLISAECLKDDE